MLIDYFPSILALASIQAVGLISPGPDFAIVMRNSLIHSRRAGVLTAVGVSLGTMVHLFYILFGVGVLISETIWLFHLFKYLGSGYLIYIGMKGLRARKGALDYRRTQIYKDIPSFTALRSGFLTSIMNVKAMLYFLSLISAFITSKEPGLIICIYGIIIFFSTLIWFSFVALCFSHERLHCFFSRFHHWIERTTGGLLMLLGIRMLFIEAGSVP
ncbi:MAG: hypothetical protein K0R76_53 [Alphaproteobacteria bacterium]|nr:hypothetical protein [Alphaproteobacteria bacterium]MDF3033099.1 hypothetical protein [Alphaproteobacteria bacterium]